MARFAELDIDNNVLRVLKGCDTDVANNGGDWSEEAATHFGTVVPHLATGVKWVQYSLETEGNVHSSGGTPIRKNAAGLGGKYDPSADGFYAEQPFPSWTLNSTTFIWESPTTKPTAEQADGKGVNWDESTEKWVGINGEPEEDGTHLKFEWNSSTDSWDAAGSITLETATDL
jgi:hypothetical protein